MTEKRASIGARRNPDTETAVLDAAAEVLAEKGISGLSMEAVAKRARAGKATLYRWWPTRGALLLAVYRRMKFDDHYPDTGALDSDIAGVLALVLGHWRGGTAQVFRSIIAAAQAEPRTSTPRSPSFVSSGAMRWWASSTAPRRAASLPPASPPKHWPTR